MAQGVATTRQQKFILVLVMIDMAVTFQDTFYFDKIEKNCFVFSI